MLYPRVQIVSPKGQVVLPASTRTALGIRPGMSVAVIPDLEQRQVVIRPLGQSNAVTQGYGLLSGKSSSLTRELMKAKKRDISLEKKKHGYIRSG